MKKSSCGLKGQNILAQPNGLGREPPNSKRPVGAVYNRADYPAPTGRIPMGQTIPRALPWAKISCTFGASDLLRPQATGL